MDLISRKEAIRKICGERCGCEPEECGLTLEQDGAEECSAVRWIKEVPSVQPERESGKWLNPKENECYECSECGKELFFAKFSGTSPKDYRFCPNCGAEMEGEQNG